MKSNRLFLRAERKYGNEIVEVTIHLDDECKNGHADFSVTGVVYDRYKRESCIITAGACHEAILKMFPEFQCFVDLHLSDCQGTPMYAVDNGYYFFNKREYDKVQDHLRLTDDELSFLIDNVSDKKHFAYLLHKLGLPKRWKEEADKAIKELEKLVGCEYEDASTKLRGIGLTDEDIADMEKKESEGYYSAEAIAKRRAEEFEKKRKDAIDKVMAEFDKATEKARNEMLVQVYILNKGLSIDNFIYYSHRNVGVFNWLDFKDKVTQEEFVDFYNNLDRSRLPEGIDFEIKV